MIAPNPAQPIAFDDLCRAAEATRTPRHRPSVRWRNQTYYPCSRCGAWKAAGMFSPLKKVRSACRRNSFCKPCARAAVRLSKSKAAPAPATAPAPVSEVFAPRGEVAGGCSVAVVPPRRSRTGWKGGEHFADVADSVGSIDPVPDAAEELNPDRLGLDPRNVERVRYERARAYNPALDWADWIKLTTRKPYPPRRRRGGADDDVKE